MFKPLPYIDNTSLSVSAELPIKSSCDITNYTMLIIQNFAVFEGGDGSGTSTQLEELRSRFSENSSSLPPFYGTFEPTKGPIGALIRRALSGESPIRAETLAGLFAADRNEHIYGEGGILEHCGRGELVVSDRFTLSSLVYQGITCGNELPKQLNAGFPVPELLVFFDLDPDIALKRMEGRSSRDIYEYRDFQIRVREGYKALLPWYEEQGVRIAVIDASRPQEEVFREVWSILQNLSIFKE
jgi:dTMP kinase